MLEKMHHDDTNVFASNIIEKYKNALLQYLILMMLSLIQIQLF